MPRLALIAFLLFISIAAPSAIAEPPSAERGVCPMDPAANREPDQTPADEQLATEVNALGAYAKRLTAGAPCLVTDGPKNFGHSLMFLFLRCSMTATTQPLR